MIDIKNIEEFFNSKTNKTTKKPIKISIKGSHDENTEIYEFHIYINKMCILNRMYLKDMGKQVIKKRLKDDIQNKLIELAIL